ncbi:SUMF1/EgtB/PvdO family nonheme iron enzyme [Sulfurimonas sp. HSL1-6]|uniref:SUMF1/EgtB/PvdO family nonheme iron enzyme n=1 Tax=Thiomicrolovo immobilis TaxID=3131935 RepID=UPI0031F9C539
MMRTIFFFLFLGVSLLFSATVEQMKSEKRYALVIANGLTTETNDDRAVSSAQALASFLKSKGFTTVTAFNLDRAELIKTFRSFDKGITPNAVITLVYSGRMVVHDSQAWMMPARMKLEGLPQLRLSAVSFDFLLQKLQRHTPRVSLGVVDAFRYSGKANTTDGELILDAVKDVKEADTLVRWNGKSVSSPLFGHLMQTVGKGHDDMDALADKLSKAGVHSRIAAADFYFNVPAKLLTPADKAWQRAEAKNSVVGYEAFLIAYPESVYNQTAANRINALKAKEKSAADDKGAVTSKNQELEKVEAELKAQQETLARLKAEQKALVDGTAAAAEAPQYIEPAEMVAIPEGVFLMGAEQFENSKPVHMVTVKAGLKMSAYEVGNRAYSAFLKATGAKYRKKKLLKNESAAVAYVSWEEAMAYAEWLSKMSGKHYRLPTEAEWEYAARAGSDTLYAWGDSASNAAQYGWMATNAHGFVHSRGLLQPNAFGLFDMAGNVAEWCQDGATPDYKSAPSKAESLVSDNEAMKIIRGGSIKSSAEELSPSYRDSNIPAFRSETVGFRLILEP